MDGDMLRGHLDAIILRLVYEKDRYGYEITKEISDRTAGEFQIKEATLYATFQRLERKGLLESYTGAYSFGGRRRYYRITTLGRAFLKEEVEEWQRTRRVIDLFMEGME